MSETITTQSQEHAFSLFEKCESEIDWNMPISKNDQDEILVRKDGPVSEIQDKLLYRLVHTRTFTDWFDGSQAVSARTGEPLLCFHGTARDIPFKEGLRNVPMHGYRGKGGIHFAYSTYEAYEYARVRSAEDIERRQQEGGDDVSPSTNSSHNKPDIYPCFVKTDDIRYVKINGEEHVDCVIAQKPEQVMHIPFSLITSRPHQVLLAISNRTEQRKNREWWPFKKQN